MAATGRLKPPVMPTLLSFDPYSSLTTYIRRQGLVGEAFDAPVTFCGNGNKGRNVPAFRRAATRDIIYVSGCGGIGREAGNEGACFAPFAV